MNISKHRTKEILEGVKNPRLRSFNSPMYPQLIRSVIATKICGSSFNWSLGVGVTEASDLGRINFLSQVWDDACDEGFVVVSHRTGAQIIFTLDKVDVTDNEINGWNFVSVCGKYKILIIND